MEPKLVEKLLLGFFVVAKLNVWFCCVLMQGSAHVFTDGVNTRLAGHENSKEATNQVQLKKDY